MARSNTRGFGKLESLVSAGLLALLEASLTLPAAAQTPSFRGLGQMPGAAFGFGTFAIGLSSNGSTVVGYAWVCMNGGTMCNSTGRTAAFRWTAVGKYQRLGNLGGSDVGNM